MFQIKIKDKVHNFYTPKEAEELGILVHRDWWNAKVGDWVLSDNGIVGQVLRKYEWDFRNRRKLYHYSSLVFACGQVPLWGNQKCILTQGKYTGFNRSNKNKNTHISPKMLKFIDLLFKNGNVLDSFSRAFRGTSFTIDDVKGKIKTTKYLRDRIMAKIKDLLEEFGLTDQFLVETLKTIIEDKEHPALRFQALLKGIELRGFEKENEINPFGFVDGNNDSGDSLPEGQQKYLNKYDDIEDVEGKVVEEEKDEV